MKVEITDNIIERARERLDNVHNPALSDADVKDRSLSGKIGEIVTIEALKRYGIDAELSDSKKYDIQTANYKIEVKTRDRSRTKGSDLLVQRRADEDFYDADYYVLVILHTDALNRLTYASVEGYVNDETVSQAQKWKLSSDNDTKIVHNENLNRTIGMSRQLKA